MRYLAILIILLTFQLDKSYSQETKHSISIGINQCVFDGGAFGPLLRFDYNYRLNKFFHLSSFAHLGAAKKITEQGPGSAPYQSFEYLYSSGLGLQVKYTPFPEVNILNRVNFQLGVNHNIEHQLYATGSSDNSLSQINEMKDKVEQLLL